MVKRIQAISALQAKLKLQRTAQMDDLLAHMTRRTTLSAGEVWMQFIELQQALVYFASDGRAVKIEGLGTFTPVLRRDGQIHLNFRADVALKNALNQPDGFSGKILNRENLGKSADELVAQWTGHRDTTASWGLVRDLLQRSSV